MGKSFSRQRDLERKLLEERDNLFQEFSHAKKEIQINFNHQRIELEDAFQQEIDNLYKMHDRQIKTIKLQMRDSQLGEMHDKFRGKLNRHSSWPIAESTPKQSLESSLSACTVCGKNGLRRMDEGDHCGEGKTTEEWQVLVQHLQFALNNQKSVFENALHEEKYKLQKQLESERKTMEENIFKRLNETLHNALKERDLLLKESNSLQSISKRILTDWVLIRENAKRKKVKNDREVDSDYEEENSGDSGVEEKFIKSDKRGNYWRIKYIESQRKHLKKYREVEENFKEQEKTMLADFERIKNEMMKKHQQELNDVQILAARDLQKLLKEERHIHKDIIKDLNRKIIEISSERDDLTEQLEEMQLLLREDIYGVNRELTEKLQLLKTMLTQD